MPYLTDNPVLDAQIYFLEEKKIFDYECLTCLEGFDSGFGISVDGEKFCKECRDKFLHHRYFESFMSLKEANVFIEINLKEI